MDGNPSQEELSIEEIEQLPDISSAPNQRSHISEESTSEQRSQFLLGERFPILEKKTKSGGSTVFLLSTTPLDEEVNEPPPQNQHLKQWFASNYKAFAVTWVGEDVSPVRILYIFVFLLSMNLLTLVSLYSLALTLLLTCCVGISAIAFFFWSLLRNKVFLGAWMLLVPVLLTLGICVSSIYFGYYVSISSNEVKDISVNQAVDYPLVDVFYFVDGFVNESLVGEYSVQAAHDETDYFCVAPIVPTINWTSASQITLWAACRTTLPCFNASTDPCISLWKTSVREGLSVWPSEVDYFDMARNNSLAAHPRLSASPSAPIIFWQEPSQILEKYKEVGTDTMAATNAIWILLTLISFSYLFQRYYLAANKYIAV